MPEVRFALLLARTLGMTLEEMSQRMSAREFYMHWADFRRSPWDEERADIRSGLIAATMVNISPNRKKGAKPAKIEDFMPFRKTQAVQAGYDDAKKFFAGGK